MTRDDMDEMLTRATAALAGTAEDTTSAWMPHLTVCYSTGEQPAAPVIAELGKAIPACEVTIDRISLVVQNGPEQLWDWRIAGAARLGANGYAGGAVR